MLIDVLVCYNVRLLSIRGVRDLIPTGVYHALKNIVSRSQPTGKLKLKGIYCLGPADGQPLRQPSVGSSQSACASTGVTSSPGAQLGVRAPTPSEELAPLSGTSGWYDGNGQLPISWRDLEGYTSLEPLALREDWEYLVYDLSNHFAFDVVSCRRCPTTVKGKKVIPRLALISLKGCRICGTCPEGPAYVGKSPEHHLPLRAPVPSHWSSVRVAQIPPSEALSNLPLIARCDQCLKDRWCFNCNSWWCESCYTPPDKISNEDGIPQASSSDGTIKIHLGLCVENCLVSELYSGVGEGGMWG